jgi:hypothetical protein
MFPTLILLSQMILGPAQNTENVALNLQHVSRNAALFVNNGQIFKKEYCIQFALQLHEHVSRTAIIILCFSCQ